MTGTPVSGASSEPSELARLRERITELEGQLAAADAARHGVAGSATATSGDTGHHRWRSLVSATLIVLACVLAPLAVTSVWADRQISETDRYVETVTPLADDPAVQASVTDRVTEAVLDYMNVSALTAEVIDALASSRDLSPRATAALQALRTPLNNGIESFISSTVSRIVASDAFAQAWVEANRVAHEGIVQLLSGEQGGAVSAQDDEITLNLAPVIAQVKQALLDQGYTAAERIPEVDTSFVLMTSDAVTTAQNGYSLLETLGYWLPVLTFLLLGLGVYVARGHRRALIAGSLGIVVGMLAVGVGLAVGRILYLDALPADASQETAGVVFDTVVRFLRTGLRAVAVLFLVVALGAFMTGPSTTAVSIRSTLSRGIGGLRSGAESRGVQTGRAGQWTFAHKRALWVGLVIAGGFTLTFWRQPTAAVVIGTALVVIVLGGLVELVSRPPAPGAAQVEPPGPEGAAVSVPASRAAAEDQASPAAVGPG